MSDRYIKFILYVIIVVLINLIAQNYFFKIDMTKTKMYSLSKKSKEVVANLKEPLTIKCFFSKDLPPPYNTIKRYLLDLLEEYSEYSNNNFNYEFYDPSQNTKYKELAQSYGISPVKVQVIQKDELKYRSVYMGIVLLHGDAIEKIPVLNTTNRLEYLLTTSIEKLINKVSYLLALKGKIYIDFYLSPELIHIAPLLRLNGLADLPKKIQKIVNELNKKYYGKLQYEYIKLKISNNEQELSKKGIQILKWPGDKRQNILPGSGGIGLIMRFKKQTIPVAMLRVINIPLIGTQYILTQPDELKDIIETGIGSLLHINQSIGYLVDHNTLSLYGSPFDSSSSASNFRQLLSEGYDINEVQLNKPIPPGLKTLIIAGPKKKFSDYELYLLDQALMHGTNLAIFLDPYIEQRQPGGPLIENKTGLEKLLSYYGINIEKGIVMDLNCFKQKIDQQHGGGERPIYFAPIIKSKNINHSLKFMKNINGLIMLKNAPISINSTLKKYAKLLFTSSKSSWVSKGNISLNPMYIYPPNKNKMKKYPLAYLIQGEFKSYFANKKVPQQEIKKQKQEKDLSKKTSKLKKVKSEFVRLNKGYGKIFIIGSSDIITNSIIDEQGDTPNSIFIMNIIDVLNDKIQRAILRSKIEEFNPLYDISNSTKLYIKTFNIIGLPILVIFIGIILSIYRKKQKNRIKSYFLEAK